jgi:hypothetical protein
MTTSATELYVTPRASPFMKAYPGGLVARSASFLEPYIITPTFTKVFDLPHIQTTWHNAFVELREAEEVVFVGYSLPDADYHLRALLIRAIRPKTTIRVILSRSDDPSNYSSHLERSTLPEGRYRRLFGDTVIFDYNGVESLIDDLVSAKLDADYEWIRNHLKRSRASKRRPPLSGRSDLKSSRLTT